MQSLMLLCLFTLTSGLRRLRYDFAAEFTIGLCAAAIGATFFYIFKDFLTVETKTVSKALFEAVADWTSYLVFTLVAILVGKYSSSLGSDGMAGLGRMVGEKRKVLKAFLTIKLIAFSVVTTGFGWLLVTKYFISVSTDFFLTTNLLVGVGAFIFFNMFLRADAHKVQNKTHLNQNSNKLSKREAMYRWRFKLLLFKNSPAILAIIAGIFFLGLMAIVPIETRFDFVRVLCSFTCGLFFSVALLFQVATDLSNSWFEKNLGVSHDEFIGSYEIIGLIMSLGFGCMIPMVFLLTKTLERPNIALHLITVILVAVVPPILAPSFSLQVDGRRPYLQIMIVVVVGLFVATAIFANPASFILVPIIRYYAKNYQNARFYRA